MNLQLTGIKTLKTMGKYHFTAVMAQDLLHIVVPPLVSVIRGNTDLRVKHQAERAVQYFVLLNCPTAPGCAGVGSSSSGASNTTTSVLAAYASAIYGNSAADGGSSSIAFVKDLVKRTTPSAAAVALGTGTSASNVAASALALCDSSDDEA